jgi:hypothetical protein
MGDGAEGCARSEETSGLMGMGSGDGGLELLRARNKGDRRGVSSARPNVPVASPATPASGPPPK